MTQKSSSHINKQTNKQAASVLDRVNNVDYFNIYCEARYSSVPFKCYVWSIMQGSHLPIFEDEYGPHSQWYFFPISLAPGPNLKFVARSLGMDQVIMNSVIKEQFY